MIACDKKSTIAAGQPVYLGLSGPQAGEQSLGCSIVHMSRLSIGFLCSALDTALQGKQRNE